MKLLNEFLPILSALFIALGVIRLLLRCGWKLALAHKYASLDGLRGYLAFFVFLHHSAIWYSYSHTGRWEPVHSHLYTHLGQSSVLFFFMITGFLFLSKILNAYDKPLNWTLIYIGRVMRLVPLYFFMLILLMLVVAVLSNFTWHETPFVVALEVIRWAGFTIFYEPNINCINDTKLIVAGVPWSLAYEWFFYLLLPMLALCVRVIPPKLYVFLSLIVMIVFIWWGPELIYLGAFSSGIVAAFVAQNKRFCSHANHPAATIFALACLVFPVIFFQGAHNLPTILLLSASFTIIACGNTILNLLTHQLSRALGEISYSIYLLHGLLLFVTFRFVVGSASMHLTLLEYWLIILVCSVILVLICYVTYRFIEVPSIRATPRIYGFIRASTFLNCRLRLTT